MHEFIPTRTRIELKKKFSREERENSARIDLTLKKPSLLSKDLYARVKEMMDEIDEEKQAKEESKRKKSVRLPKEPEKEPSPKPRPRRRLVVRKRNDENEPWDTDEEEVLPKKVRR